ncbi:hypothetical protein TNIN_51661 [Trichonephila inaurata madagascariensis]|uniref:Uncharacterized protein n=1 Tax=Trichonephila inaurata madagascariensis TaxID=2747483 RepID=A0A8X6KN15_9ARAC|nr:hypothetical protein TNIN_51661 [Trichonephila inaurata madagascariensis]
MHCIRSTTNGNTAEAKRLYKKRFPNYDFSIGEHFNNCSGNSYRRVHSKLLPEAATPSKVDKHPAVTIQTQPGQHPHPGVQICRNTQSDANCYHSREKAQTATPSLPF